MTNLLREALPPILFAGLRRVVNFGRLIRYRLDKKPWTTGYNIAKHAFIRNVLSNSSRLALFHDYAPLPERYGHGLDERCVEYPWAFSRIKSGPGKIVDAGSALNFDYLLAQRQLAGKEVHILTLAPEINNFWNLGISYVFGDLRDAPMRSSLYDVIACISTLEHVGCDNRIFTGKENKDVYSDSQVTAAAELWRMLRPGGSLLVTVPFGKRRNYGRFQQFDSALLDEVVRNCPGASNVKRTIFRYSNGGWQRSSEQDAANCEFVDWMGGTPASKPRQPDDPVASNAVGCLELTKPVKAQ